MKDPVVEELVQQFKADVAMLNKSWAALQKNDVYVRLDLEGNSTYTEPKYINVKGITQSVEYHSSKLGAE